MPLRSARETDLDAIIALIRGLAEYEHEPEAVQLDREELHQHLFGPAPAAEVILAETDDGEVAGFALYFQNFSTWTGKPGLYLEDLFVRPAFRKHGIGKALLKRLARIAVEHDCTRYVWQVLDWNTPSIDFYKAMGAKVMHDWLTCRVEGEALHRLAEGAP